MRPWRYGDGLEALLRRPSDSENRLGDGGDRLLAEHRQASLIEDREQHDAVRLPWRPDRFEQAFVLFVRHAGNSSAPVPKDSLELPKLHLNAIEAAPVELGQFHILHTALSPRPAPNSMLMSGDDDAFARLAAAVMK